MRNVFCTYCCFQVKLYNGAAIGTAVSKQKYPGFESSLGPFCAEIASLLWALWLAPKDMHGRLIAASRLRVNGCLFGWIGLW